MPRALELSRDELTPFAAALQDWMWDQRPSWPRSKLAARLGVARGTVDSWFRSTRTAKRGAQPTLPTGHAVAAVLRVTGWTPERLMELTGYRELPPPDEREFVTASIATYPEWRSRPDMQAAAHAFLEFAYAEYDRLSKQRPPKRVKAPGIRQSAQSAPAERAEHGEDVVTPGNGKRRIPVGSGK